MARLLAASVTLVGIYVLLGVALDIARLKGMISGWDAMKVNTAFMFVVSGLALTCGLSDSSSGSLRRVAKALAGLVVVVEVLTLVEYVFAVDLGIDQLLLLDTVSVKPELFPGRMSPATAFCMLLTGLSLLLLDVSPRLSTRLAQLALLIGLSVLVGYLFDVSVLYTIGIYTSMAIDTALALVMLSLGILAAQPVEGFMQVLISDSAGGIISRGLLLAIPFFVFSISGVLLAGEARGYYDTRFAMALMATLSIAVLAYVIMRIATRLHRVDLSRERAKLELAELNAVLERRVVDRTMSLEVVNASLIAEIAERQRAEEEITRLSLTDDLTGLHNRRSFFLLADQALRAARRTHRPSLLFYVDLDGLKRTNDTHGHEAGDFVISAAARVLRSCFRDNDIVARIGGDEFVILASDGAFPEIISARVQSCVDRFNQGDDCRYRLSLSIGVVNYLPHESKPLNELLENADAMMYANKLSRQRKEESRLRAATNPVCQ